MAHRVILAAILATFSLIFGSCSGRSDAAFYAATARVEALIAVEWGGVIEVVGFGPEWDMTVLDWEAGRDYLRWRMLNIERHAEFGRRIRPPKTVPEAWARHWDAGLEAFVSQGSLAFRGTRDADPGQVRQALALVENGWVELGRREHANGPAHSEPAR